jgi:hypothetical protein
MKEIFKRLSFFFPILFFLQPLLAQIETIPADKEIYDFFKRLQVKGAAPDYNDIILPLSKKDFDRIITTIDFSLLTQTEKLYLDRLIKKYLTYQTENRLLNNLPSSLFNDEPKNLFQYSDSNLTLNLNPVFSVQSITSQKHSAGLSEIGGRALLNYKDFIGIKIQASNGVVFGDRDAARLNQNVAQSFTFNNTGINFFDRTEGYVKTIYHDLALQLGRERILLGTGNIDRMILGFNPPMFDFVKFDFNYKSLSYNFIHGWLVRDPIIINIDTFYFGYHFKPEKYVAISRFGYNSTIMNLGISQMIIYADRFEAAYFNPFLFWESAQRSLNDVDNSFISIDGKFRLLNGSEINLSAIFDDIDLSRVSKGEWFDNSHGFAWQTGLFLTDPLFFKNADLIIEYTQLRPYSFSHPGFGEQLTYTNNGYILGVPIQPNSIKLTSKSRYLLSPSFSAGIGYSFVKHGRNIYDEEGNLIKNFGGDVFRYLTYFDDLNVYLLKGDVQTSTSKSLFFRYEPIIGYVFNFDIFYNVTKSSYYEKSLNIFLSFILDIH